MTHFLHTEADLDAGLGAAGRADPRLAAGRGQGRRLRAAPARGRLCRPVRHRLRPAALDRERRRDLRPAVRGLRSVPSRRGAPRAHRQARAARPVGAQDQDDQGDRQGGRQGPHRSRRGRQHGGRRRACGADRAARHRPVDRRHLSAVLPRPCRRLAGRRPRRAGSGAHRLRPAQAAGRQGAGQARRSLAAVARRGGASALGLLSRGEAARGSRRCKPAAGQTQKRPRKRRNEKRKGRMAELDGPRLEPRSGKAQAARRVPARLRRRRQRPDRHRPRLAGAAAGRRLRLAARAASRAARRRSGGNGFR